jgi:hypothetical protein
MGHSINPIHYVIKANENEGLIFKKFSQLHLPDGVKALGVP